MVVAEGELRFEQFQFDPPRLCPRDTVRFDFSYRGFPGGLAAVKNFVMEGVWEGPGERSTAPPG